MKTKNLLTNKMMAAVFLAVFGMPSLFAQTDLGSSCGCPAVNNTDRPVVLLSTLATATTTQVTMKVKRTTGDKAIVDSLVTVPAGELIANNVILTCDKTWILDKKIYVGAGKTLTINPGTVVKGRYDATPINAAALIVQRGAQIFANGTESCPIVFTAEDDQMDGLYPIKNAGRWGGVALLGRAANNLTTVDTYTGGGVDGVGFIEGFSAANPRDLYGAGDAVYPTVDNNDNSGVLKYVSIRHAGTEIAAANELNALSLGSVGSATTIDHIEIISCADDNIEIFGGTVNLKYISSMFGCDDMLDWDLGWTGKAQFIFGVTDPTNAIGASSSTVYPGSSDNGIEADADDNKTLALTLKSHPIIYNATFISNYTETATADNSGPAAIQAKENTEGEIYNSVFIGFRSGLHLGTARSTATNLGDAYDNWTNADNAYNGVGGHSSKNSLIVKNNTFVGNVYKVTTGTLTTGTPKAAKAAVRGSVADSTQFYADGNLTPASITGTSFIAGTIVSPWAIDVTANTVGTKLDAEPSLALASTITPSADGFFTPTTYRGAFPTLTESWLSKWSYASVLKTSGGLQANPTDINKDGRTNGTDLGLLLAKYGLNNL